MTLADDLRQVAARARGIPGALGLRPHRVYLAMGLWSGEYVGNGLESAVETELTEGGQPPQVKWLNEEALALGGHPVGTVEVGNLTPEHASGGVPFSSLIGTALTDGSVLYVRIVGPRHPSGARYRIREARHKSALSYSLVCTPEQ
jgi:hypothetical protein